MREGLGRVGQSTEQLVAKTQQTSPTGCTTILILLYGTMPSLLTLPVELLERILDLLENVDWKNFRRTSHECAEHVTSLIFREIAIDLEPHGCDGLASIAREPQLRQHVQTINLKRRDGLKSFAGFDDWHTANIYEYEAILDKDPALSHPQHATTLSRTDWQALSQDQLEELYRRYEDDEGARDAYATRLAAAVSTAIVAGTTRLAAGTQLKSQTSDAQQVLDQLTNGVEALDGVRNLTYRPAFEDEDCWGQRWRNIEFHPEGLVKCGGFGVEPDIDALQLYFVLRTALRAANRLDCVQVLSRGHAFWSVPHLRWLLDWTATRYLHPQSSDTLVSEGLESWIYDIGGPLRVMQYTEALTRDLVAVERSFSRLSRVEFRVDTCWSEDSGEQETIAQAISCMLKEAIQVRHLTLVLRDHASSDEWGEYVFFDATFAIRALNHESARQIMKASTSLLSAVFHLTSLRHLHLSFAVGGVHLRQLLARLKLLRHLELRYVALWPREDIWEDVLRYIAHHCRLESVVLRALEDIHLGRPRLILCPDAPIWKTNAANAAMYGNYEDAIVCFALRKSESLPCLLPDAFLRQQHDHVLW
ncbi:hypothetical protein LTR01_008820 [Friedmanniomyces endolithicus]|nr:hypothetical protein LTS09_017564 [Friedmanniomyces endolithicus]KAK0302351.1 hypothetical protein LTR01_008820 [Friedmanniomyces endolithicus]KAK0823216.1 hypothetical protein LTR73_008687 [Friedmanniomyces endolithicus]